MLYAVFNLLYFEFIEETVTTVFKRSPALYLIMKNGSDFSGMRR